MLHYQSFFPSIIWTHPLTNWSQNTMDLWLPQYPKWILNGFPALGHPFYSHTTPSLPKVFWNLSPIPLFPGNIPECPGFSLRCGLFRASYLMPDSSCSEHRWSCAQVFISSPRIWGWESAMQALLSVFLTHPAQYLSTQWREEEAVSCPGPTQSQFSTSGYLRFPQLRPPRPNGQLEVKRGKRRLRFKS